MFHFVVFLIHVQTLRLCLGSLDLLGQLGNGSEQISNESVIRDLEDWSVGILSKN
jgi:hypothetical protein